MLEKINREPAYYIEKVDNALLLVEGFLNPFNDLNISLKIKSLIQKINQNKITVYIAPKKDIKVFFKLTISKRKKDIIYESLKPVSIENLPEVIRKKGLAIKKKLRRLIQISEEIKYLKYIIKEDKKLLKKYPDDLALKLSLEQLMTRLINLCKEKKEIEKELS